MPATDRRRWLRGPALLAGCLALTLTAPQVASAVDNPILGDGTYYSADPAPLVVDDTLYIYAGRDEAGPTTNDFIMNEWQAFSTTDVSADFGSDAWQHHPALMRPEEVFAWATPGRAYAGEVVAGTDGRFYWYVPVHEADSTSPDAFGIGVAVADDPLGPWTDHAGGPIVSQEILGNTIHNIDPTVHITEGGDVHLWWGSFGNLRRIGLEADMKTLRGDAEPVTGLTGFFEAPWVFERNGTYYLAYAGNNAGPDSPCTPANYHACIAYGTAPAPEGPWTYQGTILPPVSSTTSHPGIVEFGGQWYLAYHTADAEGGNHFRRSVAIDELEWDDTQTPARILPVQTTPEQVPDRTPRANIAQAATVTVSNEPVPTQYWVKALNDEIIRPNPLPPDMWGTWSSNRPAQVWAQYTWDQPVRISGSQIQFWRDQAPGVGTGVSNPDAWVLQYRDLATGAWTDVPDPSGYPTEDDVLHEVTFTPVTTTQLRATFDGSPSATEPTTYAAVAVQEWTVLAEQEQTVEPVTATTWVGADDGAQLPSTVTVTYPGDVTLELPVWWQDVDPADLGAPGTFTVQGSVLGHAAGYVEATVTVAADAPWQTNLAPAATPDASFTAAHNRVTALNDGVLVGDPVDQALLWGTWPQVGEQWIRYSWPEPVTVNRSEIRFFQDVADDVEEGVKVPQEWRLQYWDAQTAAWTDVADPSAYGTSADTVNVTTFDPVTTTQLRAVLLSQGTAEGTGSLAVQEWRVLSEVPDTTAPVVELLPSGVLGDAGWYTSAVTARVTAQDDRDGPLSITTRIGADEPVVHTDVSEVAVELAGPGEQVLDVTVTDAAGNASQDTLTVSIDRAAPQVAASFQAEDRSVSAEATDEVSGIATVEYSVDGLGDWTPYTGPVQMDGLPHDVHVRATDVAGNVSSAVTVAVPLDPDAPLVGNIAPMATPTASFTASWNDVDAVNNGRGVNSGGDQSEVWGTWTGAEPETRWLQYTWGRDVTVDRTEIMFWADAVAGSGAGVTVPESWVLEYWDAAGEAWVPVTGASGYGTSGEGVNVTTFDAVTTSQLRATFTTHPATDGDSRSAVAVSEWQVFAVDDGEGPDTVAPTVSASVDAEARTVTVTATDTGSGVASVEYRVDGGAWAPYTAPVVVGAGAATVEFRATDVAGNVSAVGSVLVPAAGPVDPDQPPVFVDVVPGQDFYDEIRWMAERRLTTGTTVGDQVYFRPASAVSRQAMAAFMYRYAGTDWVPDPGTRTFSDVPPDHRFYVQVEWMYEHGLADGYADGTFGATRPVSRQAMAAFLYRMAGEPVVAGAASFTDVGAWHEFAEAIAWMQETEIAAGYDDGSFGTTRPVSRQAMAAFLHRYDTFAFRAAVMPAS